jgi:hypothetical protein
MFFQVFTGGGQTEPMLSHYLFDLLSTDTPSITLFQRLFFSTMTFV